MHIMMFYLFFCGNIFVYRKTQAAVSIQALELHNSPVYYCY